MARGLHFVNGVPVDDKKAIADRMSDVMVRFGLTGVGLADSCGVSNSYVSRLIRGMTVPTAEFLIALARVHRVSPTWLLLGQGPRDLEAALSSNAQPAATALAAKGVGSHPFDVAHELRLLADRVAELQQHEEADELQLALANVINAGGDAARTRVAGFLDGMLAGLAAGEPTSGERSA